MALSAAAGRVLGALAEKERTTPQGYPLTDNALLAACNQTTSRDPVVAYDVATVRMAVRELRELGLLRTVHRTGERSDKHRHELAAALSLSPGQVALLAVLLLRGPQTLAELRSRTERLHPFTSTDEVDAELLVLAERVEPLVTLLPRQPGRKEARFAQLLADSEGAVASASGTAAWPGPRDAGGRDARPGDARPGAVAGQVVSAGVTDSVSTVVEPSGPAAADTFAELAQRTGGDAADVPPRTGLEAVVAELVDEVAQLRHEVDQLRDALERATGG